MDGASGSTDAVCTGSGKANSKGEAADKPINWLQELIIFHPGDTQPLCTTPCLPVACPQSERGKPRGRSA